MYKNFNLLSKFCSVFSGKSYGKCRAIVCLIYFCWCISVLKGYGNEFDLMLLYFVIYAALLQIWCCKKSHTFWGKHFQPKNPVKKKCKYGFTSLPLNLPNCIEVAKYNIWFFIFLSGQFFIGNLTHFCLPLKTYSETLF